MNFVFSYTASKWGHKDIVKLLFSKINKGNVKDTTADETSNTFVSLIKIITCSE